MKKLNLQDSFIFLTPQKDPEELHPIYRLAMLCYNSGYKAGHHDTVEATYVDIHWSDMENYHEEEVEEILNNLQD